MNEWLRDNPDVEVIDIKMATCESEDSFMIIYRPENE